MTREEDASSSLFLEEPAAADAHDVGRYVFPCCLLGNK